MRTRTKVLAVAAGLLLGATLAAAIGFALAIRSNEPSGVGFHVERLDEPLERCPSLGPAEEARFPAGVHEAFAQANATGAGFTGLTEDEARELDPVLRGPDHASCIIYRGTPYQHWMTTP